MTLKDDDRVLTATEVAELFRVERHTVIRWAKQGKLREAFRTPSGRRRFRESEVRALLAGRGGNS